VDLGGWLNPDRPACVVAGMRAAAIDVFRGLAATGVLLSAVVHLDLWDVQNFREIKTIGPLFLLNVIGGLVIGLGVLVWRHLIPNFLAAGFGLMTVVAFWISVVHGLFGLKETSGGSSEILAEVAELVAVVFGLAAAVLLWYGGRQPRSTERRGEEARTREHVTA
jgi:hypothetical protein